MKVTVRDNRIQYESSNGFEREKNNDLTVFRKKAYYRQANPPGLHCKAELGTKKGE